MFWYHFRRERTRGRFYNTVSDRFVSENRLKDNYVANSNVFAKGNVVAKESYTERDNTIAESYNVASENHVTYDSDMSSENKHANSNII